MKIAVVARRLGYDSEASFSRAFKRVIGKPPSHFRHAEPPIPATRPIEASPAGGLPVIARSEATEQSREA
jgi:AraC-like DNA-binding protein